MSLLPGHLTGLLRFRGFITESVRREFASKHMNSAFGPLWLVVQPLAQVTIFTLVFAKIMQAARAVDAGPFDYGIYLCAGILTWGFFSEITTRCLTMFLDNANLLKKQMFPRITLPIIVLLSAAGSLAIILTILVVFLVVLGKFPGIVLTALIPLLALHSAFALALGILIGTLNVFFRDVGHFYTTALQFWFWLTPIVYPISMVPEGVRPLIEANPLTPLARAYQSVIAEGRWPDWASLASPLVVTLVLMGLARMVFKRAALDIVDEL